jgi:hypothetical protein
MANDIYNYSVMANTGKGFITLEDRKAFWLCGYPGDVWVATDVRESRHWVARHNGVSKTKDQAQTIVTAAVEAQQETWDNLSDDAKEASIGRPTDVTIP